MLLKFEGFIFGGAALALAFWELWSLRRANRRAARNAAESRRNIDGMP